jgi:hypothetical protein
VFLKETNIIMVTDAWALMQGVFVLRICSWRCEKLWRPLALLTMQEVGNMVVYMQASEKFLQE